MTDKDAPRRLAGIIDGTIKPCSPEASGDDRDDPSTPGSPVGCAIVSKRLWHFSPSISGADPDYPWILALQPRPPDARFRWRSDQQKAAGRAGTCRSGSFDSCAAIRSFYGTGESDARFQDRAAYRHASVLGETVFEHEPGRKAAEKVEHFRT